MTYEEKFADLIKAIRKAEETKAEFLAISLPQALGDNYAEMIESLNRIAAAGLSVRMLPPDKRGYGYLARN